MAGKSAFDKTWSHARLSFGGISTAGIATAIKIKELGLCIDVANGPFSLTGVGRFLITHGHLDHCAGLPYLLSQKALNRHKPALIYGPPAFIEKMQTILELFQQMEDHRYSYELIAVDFNSDYELKNGCFFRAFPTFHRVPSNGYTIFRRQKKLKEEYAGLSRESLLEAKARGELIESTRQEPIVSFSGDSRIEFLDGPDFIRKSKILFLEASFLDDKRTLDETREWGHTHLDEIVGRLKRIEAEKIVVYHLSARYRRRDVEKLIAEKIPAEERERMVIFPP